MVLPLFSQCFAVGYASRPWMQGLFSKVTSRQQQISCWPSPTASATAGRRDSLFLSACRTVRCSRPSRLACHSAASGSSPVALLSTSRSSNINEAELERLASLCQRLGLEVAAQQGHQPAEVSLQDEVRAMQLLLEEADLTLAQLEALVLRFNGEPFSRCFQRVTGWSGVCILPALRSDCGMSRRQAAQAIVKFPGLLTTYTSEPATLARRLRWHLCTDWATKQELEGEGSLAATLVREPRLLALDRDALKVKIHDLLRLVVNPRLPVPDDIVAGTGPISWDRHFCGMLQPALRDHPQALLGRGVKNLRQRVTWLAQQLDLQQRATPEAARLLVIAAGLDIRALESRVKALQLEAGLNQASALREYLLACPEVLLVPAKAVSDAGETLKGRCVGDQERVRAALQRLLRQHGRSCAEHAGSCEV